MFRKDRHAFLHQTAKQITTRSFWEIIKYCPIGQIMRRTRSRIDRKRRWTIRFASVDKQIAITHTWNKFQQLVAELFLGGLQQLNRLRRGDMIRSEVHHDLILNRHQIATNSPIVRP